MFVEKVRWFLTSMQPAPRRVRRIVKILFFLALFGILFAFIPIQKVIQALLLADPVYFTLGILFSFVATVLTAIQLRFLVRKQKIKLGIGRLLVILMGAKFYSQFLQGNIMAGGYKWYHLSQPENKPVEALAALAFFRVLETFLMVIFGLVFWFLGGQRNLGISGAWLVIVFLVSIVFWFLMTRFSVPLSVWFKAHSERWHLNALGKAFLRRLNKFIVAVVVYADSSTWELGGALLAGLLSLLAGVSSNVCMALALGIHISYFDMGWINSIISLGSQLFFVPANGLGLREVTMVSVLPAFGVGTEAALALSFLFMIRGFVNALMGGAVEAVRSLGLLKHGSSAPPEVAPLPAAGDDGRRP